MLYVWLCDFRSVLSRSIIDKLAKRASPSELDNYKIAKMLISINANAAPFTLFHELLSHSVVERRSEGRPKFIDLSVLKIGRQSFANRLSVAKSIKFDWSDCPLTFDFVCSNIKNAFFAYR